MKKLFILAIGFLLLAIGFHANAQVAAIVGRNTPVLPVDSFGNANTQSEVHISINRAHPSHLIVSANTYAPYNSIQFSQGYYVSNDSGTTWLGDDAFPIDPLVNGDPSTAIDANGNMYISSMDYGDPRSGAAGYYLDISTNNGATWNMEIPDSSNPFDKEMLAADDNPSSPHANNIYCSYLDTYLHNIMFGTYTPSTHTFSTPYSLLHNANPDVYDDGANIQIGPNGEVYVCWAKSLDTLNNLSAKGFYFCESKNGGSSFSEIPPYEAVAYKGIDLKGVGNADGNFGTTRVNSFPTMAVDKSCLHNGRIYVAFADTVGGNFVIQVCHSDSNGKSGTWSSPATVSVSATGNSSRSFFPWMDVDDVTGAVCIAYYNFPVVRDTAIFTNTNTYMAYSLDGSTYYNAKVSDSTHTLAPISNLIYSHVSGYAGDYIGLVAHNGIAYPAWMDSRNGNWQVYMAKVTIGFWRVDTNITLSSNDSLLNDIEVTPTHTLTIPSGVVVKMAAGHHIIVDTDAELVVSGTITNYVTCYNNSLWGGIQVKGNTHEDQVSSHQGTVVLNSGSKIEYAVTGITANSGIISANGAIFYNNQYDVQLSNYSRPYPYSGLNKCRFNNCTFEVDNNFLSYGYPEAMVALDYVHGVGFSGNWFEDSIPVSSLSDIGQRGFGIYCWNASCNIGTCANICLLGCCGSPNTFKGLELGIISIDPNPSNIVSIIGNSFTNNYFDINIENINNETITGNTFTKNASAGTANIGTYPYNIYLDGCTGYDVSGNTLSNTYYSTSNPSYGVIINNSGSANNVINNNTFNGIYVQSQAQGTNGGVGLAYTSPFFPYFVYSGLQFKCNQYTSAIADGADISIASGQVDANQGSNTNKYTTANNSFTYSCGSVPRSNIYVYPSAGINYFWAGSSSSDKPDCISGSVVTDSCAGLTADCTPTYIINVQNGSLLVAEGINYHVALRTQKLSFAHTYDSLTDILKRGNTPGLFTIIATGTSSSIIQDSLLAPGPYLSDSVLKAAIFRSTIPMETLASILIPNMPLDGGVVSALSSIGLPDTLVARLNEYQSDVIMSPRSVLVAGVNYYQSLMDFTDNALITALETDTTIASPFDSAQAVLKSNPVTLPRLAQLASLQWAAGENTTALVTLDTLKKHDVDSTYSNYRKLLPVLITLGSNSNGYLSLKGNSTDSILIAHIAMDTLTPGYANARAVLGFVYNESFAEPIIPLDDGSTHRAEKRINKLLITTDVSSSSFSTLNTPFNLFPNPANSVLNIQYSVAQNIQNAYVELFDEIGNKVVTWQLSPSQTRITENITNLSTGFYFYSISVNNKVIQRGKLVIAR